MVTQKTWQDVPSIPVTREQIQEARRIVDENFPQGGMMGGYMDPQDEADTVSLMYAVRKYGYCGGGGTVPPSGDFWRPPTSCTWMPRK